ncbi:MAG: flagellar motor switch protein FliN [Janthinobacterium lividum]
MNEQKTEVQGQVQIQKQTQSMDGNGTQVMEQRQFSATTSGSGSDDLNLPRLGAEDSDAIDGFNSVKPSSFDLSAVYDIPVQVSAVLGRATMQVNQLLKLGRGAVIELDRKVGEAVDVYVNNRLVARGEVVVVGEHLGITMTEIIKTDRL